MIVHVYAGVALDSLPAPLSDLMHLTVQLVFNAAAGLRAISLPHLSTNFKSSSQIAS